MLAETGLLRRVQAPLVFALCALAVMLLCSAAALAWRTTQYHRLIEAAQDQQRQLYCRLYPAQSVPLNVLGRLRAEHRRAQALAGLEVLPVDRGPSALMLLCRCLAALPAELRFRVDELRIEEGRMYLEGEVRSHGDAEVLASALRQRGGVDVDAPRSEQRGERTVAFTLVGHPPAMPAMAGTGGRP
jgi:hypothetical protein